MTLKVFNLQCDNGHSFEGWFGSSDDYESQQARGMLSCPMCASSVVRKALSAPYVATHAIQEKPAPRQQAVMAAPAQMQAALMKVVRDIVASTEDVGSRFAEEARRIHYKEAEGRAIRGVASGEEAIALREEGIEVMPVPFAELLKEPLQ
jgi:hypothetical protein